MKQLQEKFYQIMRDIFVEESTASDLWDFILQNFTPKKKESPKQIRSNQQNRYFHGVVLKILSGELGYTLDEMRTLIKIEYRDEFFTRYHDIKGKQVPEYIGTRDLTTDEMAQLCKRIQVDAMTEHNINIPDPNEADYDQIYKMYKLD